MSTRYHSAPARLLRHLAGAITLGVWFFACGDDSGRVLRPGDDGTAGQDPGGAGGAGGDQGGGAACGDGRRDGGEECDDGNVDSGDGCDESCEIEPIDPSCGDGRQGAEEECDDGNLRPGDGCDDRCREERCGNRRVDAGEECDPPATNACTASCVRFSENCGDGRVQAGDGEQCDDGNDDPADGCHDCRLQCGNGRIDAAFGEECEPSLAALDRCSDECKWLPVCGDGEVQTSAGEECDPSNGVTCVACRTRDPGSCDGGAGGAGSGGCGGSGGTGTCVPQGTSELVQNGRFDTDFTGFAPHSTAVTLRTVDDGSPSPKALEVTFASGPVRAMSGAFQCLTVRPDRVYELRAQYRIAANAEEGVGAAVTTLLYAGTRCEGAFVAPAGSGPEGRVRDAWTPYQYTVNTAALPDSATEGRLLVRLSVVRPANAVGRVLWDSVSIADPDELCGNCLVDDGETCDDGNQLPGDGCSPTCRLEICGDGSREGAEVCDDGNTVFGADGDTCTPSCRSPSDCDGCSRTNCGAQVEACLGLTGVAADGRRAGTPQSVLCDELRACVYESACHLATRTTAGVTGETLENCYCGTAGARCFDTPGRANGSCRGEVEAALETTNPASLLGRFTGVNPRYPVFEAVRRLLACEEGGACATACARPPACGDGHLQDRNLDFTFVIEGDEVPCSDEYTETGRGCSFEECDDGNDDPGDGCDEHCFKEVCGNYVTQAGEQCDDGNDDPDDGCNNECESTCGNEVVERNAGEQCDPPGGTYMCTEAEFTSNPLQCGCDDRCKSIVCGNGIVQRPAEECDPPDDRFCGTDCQRLPQGPCEACIAMNPELDPVNTTYCVPDDACLDVKECVIENDECYLPTPAACYCGKLEDYEACRAPDFVPTGPCRDEIRAGVGGASVPNTTVLDRLTDFDYPTGVAMLLLDEASRQCATECFPNAPQ